MGAWEILLILILFSPLILLVTYLSMKNKSKEPPAHRLPRELGEEAENRGDIDEAIEYYTDSLSHLENDYKGIRISKQAEVKRLGYIKELKGKVNKLRSKQQS